MAKKKLKVFIISRADEFSSDRLILANALRENVY